MFACFLFLSCRTLDLNLQLLFTFSLFVSPAVSNFMRSGQGVSFTPCPAQCLGRRVVSGAQWMNEGGMNGFSILAKGEREQGHNVPPSPDFSFPLGSPALSQCLDQVLASFASTANILSHSSPEYGWMAGRVGTWMDRWMDTCMDRWGIYGWMDGYPLAQGQSQKQSSPWFFLNCL